MRLAKLRGTPGIREDRVSEAERDLSDAQQKAEAARAIYEVGGCVDGWLGGQLGLVCGWVENGCWLPRSPLLPTDSAPAICPRAPLTLLSCLAPCPFALCVPCRPLWGAWVLSWTASSVSGRRRWAMCCETLQRCRHASAETRPASGAACCPSWAAAAAKAAAMAQQLAVPSPHEGRVSRPSCPVI